ncbi:hypothetical protein EK904_002538, partial [Melospiza melodia maxima]
MEESTLQRSQLSVMILHNTHTAITMLASPACTATELTVVVEGFCSELASSDMLLVHYENASGRDQVHSLQPQSPQ